MPVTPSEFSPPSRRRLPVDIALYAWHSALMTVVSISEAKSHLSRYVRMAQGGQSVLITQRRAPVCEMRPVGRSRAKVPVRLGLLQGTAFKIADDFDAEDKTINRDWYGQ